MLNQDVDVGGHLNNTENNLTSSSILTDIKLARYILLNYETIKITVRDKINLKPWLAVLNFLVEIIFNIK